jgi:hypothetical protein
MAETLLVNDLTRYGLRRLHILGNRKVETENWLGMVPWEARGEEKASVQTAQYQDAEIGFWHLWVVWHVRGEPVRMQLPTGGQREGILWYVEPGERMSEVIEAAALRFLAYYDCWPACALAAKLPKGAAETVKFEDRDGLVIGLQMAEWVPSRCIFVTRS